VADSIQQNLDAVTEAKTNPDGSTSIKYNDGRQGVKSQVVHVIEIPQEPIHGVPGHAIVQFMTSISRRRPPFTIIGTYDPVKLFETIVPTENGLQELEEASTLSNEKMLLLGDALMIGVHGWPRDYMRATRCYNAAAMGCQESEERSERKGIPVGSPEAMMQTAYVGFAYIKKELLGLELWDNISSSELVRRVLQKKQGLSLITYHMYFLYSFSSTDGLCFTDGI